MKHLIIPLIVSIFATTSYCQKYDNQWIFGYSDAEELGFGINLLDFNNGKVDVSFYTEAKNYMLAFDGSFLNNPSTGLLSYHTNGCHIKDQDWNIISGEDYLQGDFYQVYCDIGYTPIEQGTLLLPDLVDDAVFYIITKNDRISPDATDLYSENVFYGTVHKNNDGYDYSGLIKINEEIMFAEDITATPNATKDAWWVLQARNQSNVIEKYLVANDTLIRDHIQQIGPEFKALEQGIGQNTFSPDGTMYAINTTLGIQLYDFDNESGQLSNARMIPYPDSDNVNQGLGFSSNGRFIYVTTAENVYQIDLLLMDDPYHIGYFRSVSDTGWPVGLGMILPGPDCRLYVSPGSTTNWLHVILNPNEKGKACNFKERAIELPARVKGHLPNLPNYRYLTGCDSTIVFPFVSSTVELSDKERREYLPYPNPTSGLVYIPQKLEADHYILYSIHGQKLQSLTLENNQLDIGTLPKGVYILELYKGNAMLVRQKVIKQ